MNNIIVKPEQPQKTIYQYTDAQEFYNDYIPQQQQSQQNKKPLEKQEIQQIKELYIQLGFKGNPCSYGYTQNGNEDIDKILNILLKSQDFRFNNQEINQLESVRIFYKFL
ncbi:hypothetical protein PPERSA_05798 [Pseudocohnilembus persalinus]|uniref:Uncharacterized protein n=1 Tax=Pseudocohnilembus persalinus TaxID=266149 RepID=A0A0V0QZK0_PSEPJ|nr:hypothetical protein PPERSA_05798 [Pseudocohnilembus persalinus]|eukprot:KRX07735.1 hypothetical protein PPERSA_05798 [Pseudocohnilembus persalinus]